MMHTFSRREKGKEHREGGTSGSIEFVSSTETLLLSCKEKREAG